VFEAGIAKRHAFEMFEIERTVIGSERRRWHPFYPFEMKRHDLAQISLPYLSRQARFGQPITKLVNGTFDDLPQLRLHFAGELPQSAISHRNFVRP